MTRYITLPLGTTTTETHVTMCHRCGLPLREADYSEGAQTAWCTSVDGGWCQERQRRAAEVKDEEV